MSHKICYLFISPVQMHKKFFNILTTFKPHIASLGFALFLAINASGVWGGVFPFIPIKFQTPEILLLFFLAQSLVFTGAYFASALGVYYFPQATKRFMVILSCGPYLCGWFCLIAAMYLPSYAMFLVLLGGALIGIGAAGFYMMWQRLFAGFEPEYGTSNLMLGFIYGAIFYFALYLIPQALTIFLIPLIFVPLFALAIILESRKLPLDQPMFEDIPKKHSKIYKQTAIDYWRSTLCIASLAFCAGIMRAFAIKYPSIGTLVNFLSMGSLFVVGVGLLLVWQFKDLRLSIHSMYRIAFPFVITSFVLLPFLGNAYEQWQAAILYAIYSASIIFMMLTCAQASRDKGINPVFIYGLFGGVVYGFHDLGFLIGTFAETWSIGVLDAKVIIALCALYLLGLIFFIGQGGFSHALGKKSSENIELLMSNNARERLKESKKARRTRNTTRAQNLQGAENSMFAHTGTEDTKFQDRLSKQIFIVQQNFALSTRETEIMELIVRGNTVSRIAEVLVVSENTVRTHAKRIYAKVDVHSKQELRDVVDSVSLQELD